MDFPQLGGLEAVVVFFWGVLDERRGEVCVGLGVSCFFRGRASDFFLLSFFLVWFLSRSIEMKIFTLFVGFPLHRHSFGPTIPLHHHQQREPHRK